MSRPKLQDNVERKAIGHAKPAGVENGVDVSVRTRTWRSYFWDTWDKSPEACTTHSLIRLYITNLY